MKKMRSAAALCLVAAMLLLGACRGGAEDETTDPSEETYSFAGTLPQFSYNDVSESASDDINDEITRSNYAGSAVPSTGGNSETKKDTTNAQATVLPNIENPKRESVQVTVPDGATMAEIFALLDASGVASFSSLMNSAMNIDYSYYPLLTAQKFIENRPFRLEGYLCTGTYTFYTGMKPEDAIARLLRSTETRVNSSMRSQVASQGFTTDEIITIASIIEKECDSVSEMTKVAAVIHNRLKLSMKLESSVTGNYLELSVKPYISDEQKKNSYDPYYDTYVCDALPEGPICSPGTEALKAALNPAGVDYVYFCRDSNGSFYYAATAEEHNANLVLAGLQNAENS